jgi:hypothetical protein
MTEGKVFLDTNILVYAHDTSAGTKHDLPRGIVAHQMDASPWRAQHPGAAGILRVRDAKAAKADGHGYRPEGCG